MPLPFEGDPALLGQLLALARSKRKGPQRLRVTRRPKGG